ncbi:MAG: hypothetical protein CMG26_01190 [Candidatus Marinimicrobia bacterium]|nr:hypothetical protein [Candidatus Neomarinimicrobiota bacterium]|tara:strand:- start:410 stop:856 length:447 start_codon:yes stop_codon:yes gene_type:complete
MIKKVAYSILVLCSFLFSLESDIIKTLEDYNDAFVTEDYKNIPYFFDFPVSFNLKDKSVIAGNKLKLRLIYKKLRGGLPENYSYSKWENFNIQVLDNTLAIVDASFSRYDNDDTIIYSGNGFYTLRKIDNKWKIYSLTPYDNIIKTTD